MRFVCDQCKAKYAIGDDKVRGKILKIRCKRCGNLIEVRDPRVAKRQRVHTRTERREPTPPPESFQQDQDEPTQVSNPSLLEELKRTAANLAIQPAAVQSEARDWYAALGDQPQGPFSISEIKQHVESGNAKPTSLVWREGFTDWRPLRDCGELAHLLRRPRVGVPTRPGASPPEAPLQNEQSGQHLAEVIPFPPNRGGQSLGRPSTAGSGERLSEAPTFPPGSSGLGRPATGAGPREADPAARVAMPLRGHQVGRLGAAPSLGAAMFQAHDVHPSVAEGPETSPVVPTPGLRPEATPVPDHPAQALAPDQTGESLIDPAVARAPRQSISGAFAYDASAPPPPMGAQDPSAVPPAPPETSNDLGIGQLGAPGPVNPAMAGAMPAMGYAAGPLPEPAGQTRSRRPLLMVLLGLAAIALGVGVVVVSRRAPSEPEAGTVTDQSAATTVPTQPLIDQPEPTKRSGVDRDVLQGLRASVEETPSTPAKARPTGGRRGLAGGQPRKRDSQPTKEGSENGSTSLSEADQRLLARTKELGAAGVAPISAPIASRGDKSVGSGSFGPSSAPGRPLSADQIRSTVRKNQSSVQRCYEREMRGARSQGDLRVVVRIRIGRSGTVRSARIGTASVRGTALGACMEKAIRRWSFPRATGESEVESPFFFTPRR